MFTAIRSNRVVIPLIFMIILTLASAAGASADIQPITLGSVSPSSGQAGITNVTIRGTGFPGGMILPGSLTVQLTPNKGGPVVTTPAFPMTRFGGERQAVSFVVPTSISVTSPTQYEVSLSGTALNKEQFTSVNTLTLTVNPPPGITLSTTTGAAGQTVQVDITGTYTNFARRITAANFGPGISVGKGSPSGWGHLVVTSPTSATAIVKIDPQAKTGPRTITIRTGAQEETATFTVNAASSEAGPGNNIDASLLQELDATGSSVKYTITDLGTLGGGYSESHAINDLGQVTGYSHLTGDAYSHAFIYSAGVMTDIGAIEGDKGSCGYDINNAAQVAGSSGVGEMFFIHAFLYSSGTMTDLGSYGSANSWSWGAGINSYGEVTGNLVFAGSQPFHAFIYSDGSMTDLGTLGGSYSVGHGINDFGQVTGTADTSNGYGHAFLYSNGTITDLNTLGGNESYGYRLNNAGQIVGRSDTSNGQIHAFIYSNGTMTDLGSLGGNFSAAYDLNNSAQVVGATDVNEDTNTHAFIYNNGTMADLNTLIPAGAEWTLTEAVGINNSGQIIANGVHAGMHAFLLSPQTSDLTITKTHRGSFRQGQSDATYTIRVTNSGNGPTTGTVSVTDTLPTGLTATSLTGPGWSCNPSTLTCTRSNVLKAGRSYPTITLKVNVAANAPTSVTNTVLVSGGGETDTTNNTAIDVTTITPVVPDLTITKKHSGRFRRGKTGTYTIRVSNSGNGPTSGAVRVEDSLPTDLTATYIGGSGWDCDLSTLICTRSNVLKARASYPPIILRVKVATDAPASVTNTATVSGGGESDTGNNTAKDVTVIY